VSIFFRLPMSHLSMLTEQRPAKCLETHFFACVVGCACGAICAVILSSSPAVAMLSVASSTTSPITSQRLHQPAALAPRGPSSAPQATQVVTMGPTLDAPSSSHGAAFQANTFLTVLGMALSAGVGFIIGSLRRSSSTPPIARRVEPATYCMAAAAAATSLEVGQFSILGSVRKQNEDRCDAGPVGPGTQFLAVFDGHGGNAVSEWLQKELRPRLERTFDPARPESSLNRAFLSADRAILQPARMMFGIPGERGFGGAQCGSTAAVAIVYEHQGVRRLAVGNVGDARCLIIKADGRVTQLTVDHVPDSEDERLRIESKNPNPKMPLVRFVGETWRVGGLLALSRAFGDAYLKSTGQFEGVSFNNSDYESGFGVIAEPDTAVVDLQPDDLYVILSSDGLYANENRGGGGGFENDQLGPFVLQSADKPLSAIAEALCREAQRRGSTDDISVVLYKLN